MTQEYNLEPIYDEQIAPLMTEIIRICREHGLPFICSFAYRYSKEDGYDCCTSYVEDAKTKPRMPAEFRVAVELIYG